MIRKLIGAGLFLALAPFARAETIVVELFVSQNCKACPPAQDLMRELSAERGDLLVLSWGVSYWDYLGEQDPTALPVATERQRNYAENMGLRGPYTPQAIYDGVSHCPGNRRRAVVRELTDRASAPRPDISLTATDTGFRLTGETAVPMQVSLVKFRDMKIRDGYTVTNSVTAYQKVADWSGGDLALDVTCEMDCAILVQEPGEGEILAAAQLN